MAHQGFFYAPDERLLSTADFLAAGGEWLAAQLTKLNPDEDKEALLKLWRKVTYEELPADFAVVPYCNLNTGNLSYLPVKMVAKMYMSNGMCAGNTPEEALVQGIAELFERHVNQRIVREKLVPPTIPGDYIARFPRIAAMIAAIEARGDCRVILKDCSLGRGYPVVGVIYINLAAQSYFVKFGAHPLFEIAAERTLTELLQGQDIGRMMGMREFSFRDGSGDGNNLIGILVNGSGVYPSEFFGPQPSYPFREWDEVKADGNRKLLHHLLAKLAVDGFEVYARDVSFLGFPAFQVIVPHFSEIETFGDIGAIEEYADYNEARRLIRRLDELDKEERGLIIGFLRQMPYSPDTNVFEFLNQPVSDPAPFPWYFGSLDLLLTVFLLKNGDLQGAAAVFERYAAFSRKANRPEGAVTFYRCVADYLGARASGRSEAEIAATLGVFYPEEVVAGVLKEWGDPSKLDCRPDNPRCFDCARCAWRGDCLHPETERVYLLLKERQAANPIDQRHLAALGMGAPTLASH
ncbi:YcaO-like family protein [Anaeroselena agilis]|uniref:YcaO-like family protein n=1 Tax=Anaeroselena agilis TaxID=3063788 RepID=A0ABU3NSW5_9FIRM|nr:YcaO-like family protein [Selenomonadales bacterium 4137-cl]